MVKPPRRPPSRAANRSPQAGCDGDSGSVGSTGYITAEPPNSAVTAPQGVDPASGCDTRSSPSPSPSPGSFRSGSAATSPAYGAQVSLSAAPTASAGVARRLSRHAAARVAAAVAARRGMDM